MILIIIKITGPLEVTDIHAEGCKVKWEKPEDDGGSPVKEYELEKMDVATGKWVRVGRSVFSILLGTYLILIS